MWRGFRFASLDGQWRHLLVLSLLCIAVSNGLQIWAMQWVQANTSALLNASCALWIVLFGLTGRRAHHPGARTVVGIVIGFIGTALLVWPTGGAAATSTPLLPQLMILASCIFWSLGTIYMRNHTVDIDLFALLGLQMLLGGVWLTLAGLVDGEASRWQWSLEGQPLACLPGIRQQWPRLCRLRLAGAPRDAGANRHLQLRESRAHGGVGATCCWANA